MRQQSSCLYRQLVNYELFCVICRPMFAKYLLVLLKDDVPPLQIYCVPLWQKVPILPCNMSTLIPSLGYHCFFFQNEIENSKYIFKENPRNWKRKMIWHIVNGLKTIRPNILPHIHAPSGNAHTPRNLLPSVKFRRTLPPLLNNTTQLKI